MVNWDYKSFSSDIKEWIEYQTCKYQTTRNLAALRGTEFLAYFEGCTLRLQQKGPLGQKMILVDGRTTGLRDLDAYPY